jgi:hypothetical protein
VAVTGNLTITSPTAAGYASIGPTMTSSPATSAINFRSGQTLANNLTLRLGSGGSVGAVIVGSTGMRAHMILDVTGYYRSGSGGAEWYPIAPKRQLDTRTGTGLSGRFKDGTARTFQVSGGTVPGNAVAVVGNLTATGTTGNGYVAADRTMGSTAKTSVLNATKNQNIANGINLRLTSGKAAAVYQGTSGTTTHLVLDLVGYFR